jgi:hypothetical protein
MLTRIPNAQWYATEVVKREGDGAQDLIFARNLSAGGWGEDGVQTLTWEGGVYEGAQLFYETPKLVVAEQDGDLVGKLAANLQVHVV